MYYDLDLDHLTIYYQRSTYLVVMLKIDMIAKLLCEFFVFVFAMTMNDQSIISDTIDVVCSLCVKDLLIFIDRVYYIAAVSFYSDFFFLS